MLQIADPFIRTNLRSITNYITKVTVKLDRRLTKFVHSTLTAQFRTTESSVVAENCRFLMYKYDISVFA